LNCKVFKSNSLPDNAFSFCFSACRHRISWPKGKFPETSCRYRYNFGYAKHIQSSLGWLQMQIEKGRQVRGEVCARIFPTANCPARNSLCLPLMKYSRRTPRTSASSYAHTYLIHTYMLWFHEFWPGWWLLGLATANAEVRLRGSLIATWNNSQSRPAAPNRFYSVQYPSAPQPQAQSYISIGAAATMGFNQA